MIINIIKGDWFIIMFYYHVYWIFTPGQALNLLLFFITPEAVEWRESPRPELPTLCRSDHLDSMVVSWSFPGLLRRV